MIMKKAVSVFLTLLMLFAFALPCFAENPAKFSINILSENDKELIISVDYDGGSSFQNIDLELKYDSKKLKPTEANDGDGLTAFAMYAKRNDGNSISMINKDKNPIKGVMAATIPFKAVQGKDLFQIKFQKLSKFTAGGADLSLKLTNCQLDYANIKTEIKTPWANGSAASASDKADTTVKTNAPAPDKNTPNTTPVTGESKPTEQQSVVTATDADETVSAELPDENGTVSAQNTDPENTGSEKNIKKAVMIPAIVICVLFVAVAAVVFISRKKENSKES